MKLRKLVVANETYLWRRTSLQLTSYEISPWAEEIVVYRQGHQHSPLRLLFKEDDNSLLADTRKPGQWLLHGAGKGICWFSDGHPGSPGAAAPAYNFNQPAVIANLVRFFLTHGWHPAAAATPHRVADALKHLNNLPPPLDSGF